MEHAHCFHASDRGSGTVAGAFLIMLAALLMGTLATAAHIVICQAKARSVADLTAISAAYARRQGGRACDIAFTVVRGHDMELAGCDVQGDDVSVEVTVSTSVPFAPHVTRSSRAGPASCR